MLKLKLEYFGHLMLRANSLEKALIMGKIEGRRRRGWQRMWWLDGITRQWIWVWASSRSWWRKGKPGVLWSMGSQRVGHDWAAEQQQDTWLGNIFSHSVGCLSCSWWCPLIHRSWMKFSISVCTFVACAYSFRFKFFNHWWKKNKSITNNLQIW